MKREIKISLFLTCILVAYMTAGLYIKSTGISLRWLFWNLFLAVIPLYIALTAHFFSKIKVLRLIIVPVLLALWILFLPNSCYMLTDLVHLDTSGMIIDVSSGQYSTSLAGWIRILYITVGVLLGFFFGLYSAAIVRDLLNLKPNHRFFSFCYSLITSLLVGYGVYIGRFLRFNSWDILHPRSLMLALLEDLDLFALKFSCIIAVIFLVCYWLICLLLEAPSLKRLTE